MRRLLPVTDLTTPAASAADREWTLDELADAYAYPEGRRPWLRANMVSTLDGAAQHDGRSQGISCPTDMRIFGTLRGLADVVVVGAETVRLEGYRPAKAREAFAARRAAAGQAPAPAIAVVSASLDLDFSLPLFTSPLVPTFVITGAAAPLGPDPRGPGGGGRGAVRRGRGVRRSGACASRSWPGGASAGSSPRAGRGCSASSWRPVCWTSSA